MLQDNKHLMYLLNILFLIQSSFSISDYMTYRQSCELYCNKILKLKSEDSGKFIDHTPSVMLKVEAAVFIKGVL